MNYKIIHDNIIERAKNRILKENEYYEIHHIIPKCLGGLNNKSNLVRLTAREHFIIHWLLAEIENIPQLWFAFHLMVSSTNNKFHKRYTPSSRVIEYAKIKMSKIKRSHTEETKTKISKNNAKWNLGKKLSEETKQKISQSNTGKKRTIETKQKISDSHKGLKTKAGTKNKKRKIIQKLDINKNIIEEFDSGYGTDSHIIKTYPSIYNIINKNKIYKGFYFQYKNN